MPSGTALALLKTLDFCDPQSPFGGIGLAETRPAGSGAPTGRGTTDGAAGTVTIYYSSNLTDIVEGGTGKFATANGAGNLTNSDIFVNPPMTTPDPGTGDIEPGLWKVFRSSQSGYTQRLLGGKASAR